MGWSVDLVRAHTCAKAMFVSAGSGGGGENGPHKKGRKENRGREGRTVCAKQECLLKTKPIKASGIKTRSVLEGNVNSCSQGSSFNQEPIGQWQLRGLK